MKTQSRFEMEPQTAEQINFSQVGSVKLPPKRMPNEIPNLANIDPASVPLPAGLAQQAHIEAQKTAKEQQAGWWSLRGLSGSVQAVLAEIEKSDSVPRCWKDAIRIEIQARCGSEFNSVEVDAHYFLEKGRMTMHLGIVPCKRLI